MEERLASWLLFAVAVAGCAPSGGSRGGALSVAPATSATLPSPIASSTLPGATSAPSGPVTPSDDPDDYTVDTTRSYDPFLSPPAFVVPSPALPAGVQLQPSNNNCALVFHEGKLFFAFRTSATHFASSTTRLYVLSSPDMGKTWDLEHEVFMGTDMREPSFVSIAGRLVFRYFEAGSNPLAFEPKHIWQTVRTGPGQWSAPTTIGDPGEIAWETKVRRGLAYQSSYLGNHYGAGAGQIDVRFSVSDDGTTWKPVDPAQVARYTGGVSEVGWEFDENHVLWAVGRNEDGDASGFGSLVFTDWAHAAQSNPNRYDSPKMLRHGDDLYLIARRDVGGPFDLGWNALPFDVRKWTYLALYSLRAKTTALYSIDRATKSVVWLQDLPGDGDTAFPAVARLDADHFLIANYTSPLGNPDRPWIGGQLSPQGTQIYFTTLELRKH